MTARREDSPCTNLCQFQFADGRLCSMPGIPSLKGLSRSHAAPGCPRPQIEKDLSYELSPCYSPTDGHLDVHGALERVFKMLSSNRISTRRAATFGYLGQLILLSNPDDAPEDLSKREMHDL